ncbi:MAG: DEAD/DEAH box helicase [SAR324 cluster bacterium]|nr:DEAD/DEAH box helicase [SAR324 cluster bacterium]
MSFSPGTLVTLRDRDWVVLPSEDPDLLVVKPLGGSEDEITGVYLPLNFPEDQPVSAEFPTPAKEDLGDISSARLLYDSVRLSFRNGAGPFRCLAKLSFRPRSYQMVPLVMALRQETVRLLIADDVGVGKTIEALLIVKELLERRKIKRFAVVCLPHLCEQWQSEIKEKIGLEAVIIRTNTQARLDREIQGDVSVYDYYPYQIISIDYIKGDSRRQVFIEQCPEMVIVDEAHTCACPVGASIHQQQRHFLVNKIASKPDQHLIMLTATPHSGKNEEFLSLLGLLKPEFETMDLPSASPSERKDLARYFVQRQRSHVEKWMNEDTPFPERDPGEFNYRLSRNYASFFDQVLSFAQKLVSGEAQAGKGKGKTHYWTALALLRGVMSSPAAGIEMLKNRMQKLFKGEEDWNEEDNPVHDLDYGFETDVTPGQLFQKTEWSQYQLQQLREFTKQLEGLANPDDDQKLAYTALIIEEWIEHQFNPVIFCRYIATAKYIGEHLEPLLKKKFPKMNIQVITSEDPDEVRKQRISQMEPFRQRVLIATDCLSEGINLQEYFTAVLHYDLPWNPNRLEQREGRVDRFGQLAKTVKAYLLYGENNPIDGIILDVLLRKVREIKKSIGINVPFPEDSKSIIDTITQALLLNPDRKIQIKKSTDQLEFNFDEFSEASEQKLNVTRKIDEAAEREKATRSIFAQNAIKPNEIEADLKEMSEAIGDPKAVEEFVFLTLNNILGVQMDEYQKGYRVYTANLPYVLKSTLPDKEMVLVSFDSPTPENYLYLGRNHLFVEHLCMLLMANSLNRSPQRASRSAVIRSKEVAVKTTLLLFRVRNVIEARKKTSQIIAEEMLVWGYRGIAAQKDFLTIDEASCLMKTVRPTSNMTPESRANFLENELKQLPTLKQDFDQLAEGRSKKLVEAHERFSKVMGHGHFQVVYPVLPMDILGMYILLPDLG